jgi:uncharacterized Zn finger protein (UPF0148 family)
MILLCPLCGDPLKWSCGPKEGEAYCSALQSRVVIVGQEKKEKRDCDFVGRIRRVSPSEVELCDDPS